MPDDVHRRSGPSPTVALTGAVAAVVCFTLVHLTMMDVVDPVREPVSVYALIQPGTTLFGLGTLGLAVACVALAVGGLSLSRQGHVRALLAFAAVMLVAVVAFPTDAGQGVSSVSGHIHRYAAGAAFAAVTAAGLLTARRLDDRVGGRLGTVLAILAVSTLALTIVNTFVPSLADGRTWRGIPQRMMLTVQMLLMVTMSSLSMRLRAKPPHSMRNVDTSVRV